MGRREAQGEKDGICESGMALTLAARAYAFQRQFQRLLEMLLLRDLDREDKIAYRAWRLQVCNLPLREYSLKEFQVKARLFRFNYVRIHNFSVLPRLTNAGNPLNYDP